MSKKDMFLKSFIDGYSTLNETKQSDFSRIFSKLINQNFILKECEEDKNDYFFIGENKEMISDFFRLLDFELVYQPDIRCFYLKTSENRNRVHLTKFDTVLLILLRKIFHEKRKEITSDDKVFVTLDELVDQVKATQIFIPDKKASAYVDSLRKFRTHKIVDYPSGKVDIDLNIQILSSILIIVPQEGIDELVAKLEAFKLPINQGDEYEDSNED